MNNHGVNQMTGPKPLYNAEEVKRQDILRQMTILGVSILGIGIATTYIFIFSLYINNKFSLMSRGTAVEILSWVAGFIVLISPTTVVFISWKTIRGIFNEYVKTFYNISNEIDFESLINRRLYGIPPENPVASTPSGAFIVINSDKLEEKFSWVYYLGGPIKLIIYDGYAVYLERGNTFSRVVGSGIVFMERYETIRDIIDLHPQIKTIEIDAWTKDGIKLTLHVRVTCQILSAEDAGASHEKDSSPESEKRSYPFYDKAVQAAVETAAVFLGKDGQPEKYNWVAGVCGNLEGHIREHVYSNTINDLLRGGEITQNGFETRVQQFQALNYGRGAKQLFSNELRDLLLKKVNTDVENLGCRLVDIQVINVDKSRIVDQQWEQNWRAEWTRRNIITAGEVEAYKIRTKEIAHAEAQKDMIIAIARGLEKMGTKHNMSEPLLLSLSGMLENSLVDPYVRAALPRETLETLEKIKVMLEEPSS
ncbi:MAG: hypothetical protein C4583_06055 [Anaerolineaceae bacterium]|nr:MAG: hypothetical protein C4583_06055 [Anaerolineaceae bacterium]